MAQDTAAKICRELFSRAGITVNGHHPYDIQVHHQKFFARILQEESLGLGESYMDGWWDCDSLDEMISRLIKAKVDEKVSGNWKIKWHVLRSKLLNLQTIRRAVQVAHQHYDIGNDLYQKMLDKRLNYTCGYWRNAKTLDQAQENKLDLVCKKNELAAGMTVLELGCGFGAFAKYAVEKYGVKVTAVNISEKQLEIARQSCQGLPVEFQLKDYREVSGEYDRVISIGIMEHVGIKNYRTYMSVVNRCLNEQGIAFIHTIGCNVSKTYANAWTNKYIFPNGMLPSIAQLSRAMEGYFIIEDLHNFGPDYDRTLMAWYHNFNNAWPNLKSQYNDRFYRMWRYYLLSCAGGFRARGTQLWQLVLTRPGRYQPNCRVNE